MIRPSEGRIWRFGDQVDTDALAPARFLKLPIADLATHCLETLRPEFARAVRPGDLVVGGIGFGIGSSREQAAAALKQLGVAAVIATGAARIFYRNAINLGLPVLNCADTTRLIDGLPVSFDLERAEVRSADGEVMARCEPMPDFLREIVCDGGLVANLRRRLGRT
jgi:3-isopropylmalate/(R)-2-methylmalate dehydratase small subunit